MIRTAILKWKCWQKNILPVHLNQNLCPSQLTLNQLTPKPIDREPVDPEPIDNEPVDPETS